MEAAHLLAGGDIMIRQGMNASGEGEIRAAGNVNGCFFEATKIYAEGDIQGDYFMNCDLYAQGRIYGLGKKEVLQAVRLVPSRVCVSTFWEIRQGISGSE